jgi:endonuclease YncB( thermonuclease family)
VVQRDALLRPHKTDPYGRLVAVVSIGDADVGLAQVRAGLAWHFKRYAKEQSPLDRALYADAEMDARRRRVGLWAEPAPVAPWDFRSRARPVAHAP